MAETGHTHFYKHEGDMTEPPQQAGTEPAGVGRTAYPAGTVYVQQPQTNGLAIASLVVGVTWLYFIGSILAVVFGHIALNQINKRGDNGRGLAVAGIVLGYVGIALLLTVVTIGVVASING